ncbi:hypothetical protein DMH17_12220 [Raoultella planticola]|nr:hypothetical protein [Raoultella planticola]
MVKDLWGTGQLKPLKGLKIYSMFFYYYRNEKINFLGLTKTEDQWNIFNKELSIRWESLLPPGVFDMASRIKKSLLARLLIHHMHPKEMVVGIKLCQQPQL